MTRRRRWKPLQAGVCVDIVAPASRCSQAELNAGIEVLRSWGLEPRVPIDVFGDAPFTANTEALRWRQLRDALRAEDSAAVWCLRGGYGSAHMVAPMARLARPVRPKPLIGFSDITALLYGVNALWGWDAIHGPVVAQLGTKRVAPQDLRSLRELLFSDTHVLTLGGLRALNSAASACGDKVIEGRVHAGNLASFMSLCGGPLEPQFASRIVVLEDVNERGYQVDRFLFSLWQSGAFKRARAVVFGDFLRGEEADGKSRVNAALEVFAERLACPVFTGLPVGHGRRAPPLTVGAPASIAPAARARFVFEVQR